MNFNQLVWKMAKQNKRKYIFYLLSNSFSVMIFFIFCSLLFNEKISESGQLAEGIQEVMIVPAVALIVFSVFFISFAHSLFIKRRKKEFGLFMTLGMSFRDITKILLLENAIIAVTSIIIGVISGMVFSRLFFLIIMNSIDVKGILFQLNVNVFLISIGAFLLVFSFAVGKTLFVTRNKEITRILKEDRVSDHHKAGSPILGSVGFIIVIGSLLFLYVMAFENTPHLDGYILLVGTVLLLVGLYIMVSHLGSFLIRILKRRSTTYYRNLLLFSNLNYKFKQLKNIFFIIIVMTMVTIFYSSFMLQLLSTAEQGANERHPFDIGFIQTEEKNNISIEELYHIIDTTDHPITEHYMIETFDYFEPHSGYDLDYRYTFVPIKEFNKLHTGQLHIPEGHYIYFINQNAEYAFGNSDYENGIAINTSPNPITLSLEKTINGQLFNNLNYHNFDFIILNDADYELIKNTVEVYDAKIHLLNVTDWKRTTIAVQGLIEKLQSKNTVTEPLFERIEFTSEQELLMPSAKVEDYTYNRQGAGLLLFLSTFLGVLFFFATFMILFLRLYSDIDQEKKRVNKLYKIGVTKVEISKLVSRELQILFISAPIVGILIAFVYLTIFFKDVGGLTHSMLVSFSIISGLYLFLQLIYYFYARTRFYNEITDELV